MTLSKVSGDSQAATLGTAVGSAIVVRVTDSHGTAASGVTVTWVPAIGSGRVTPTASVTDAHGQASALWTVDTTFLGNTLTAKAGSQTIPFAAFGNGSGSLGGRRLFPADNAWNADISGLPVDAHSATLIGSCGAGSSLHPDFGTVYAGAPNGIPYVVVHGTQPLVPVSFTYAGESDGGPYPVPAYAPIEGGPGATGDRHVLIVDSDH